jgi:hypothetical protein
VAVAVATPAGRERTAEPRAIEAQYTEDWDEEFNWLLNPSLLLLAGLCLAITILPPIVDKVAALIK